MAAQSSPASPAATAAVTAQAAAGGGEHLQVGLLPSTQSGAGTVTVLASVALQQTQVLRAPLPPPHPCHRCDFE